MLFELLYSPHAVVSRLKFEKHWIRRSVPTVVASCFVQHTTTVGTYRLIQLQIITQYHCNVFRTITLPFAVRMNNFEWYEILDLHWNLLEYYVRYECFVILDARQWYPCLFISALYLSLVNFFLFSLSARKTKSYLVLCKLP